MGNPGPVLRLAYDRALREDVRGGGEGASALVATEEDVREAIRLGWPREAILRDVLLWVVSTQTISDNTRRVAIAALEMESK